ncbi:MAG: cobalamin biosynthesis protein CobD, partial [Firmicutes bacterium]|nr:cobalamin biosynthesis protein CobD [Bacillota bacterium]
MTWLICLGAGFIIDLIIGDPHSITHPVVIIGKEISLLEKLLRKVFPKTPAGERMAGGLMWIIVVSLAWLVPSLVLRACARVSPVLVYVVGTIMCWQILAAKSLKDEALKVQKALENEGLEAGRRAVSMIVGRDTARLDEKGVARAAVETVAENFSDGVMAPIIYMAVGGPALGFLYKAVNTMDSMTGYIDPPYTYFGFFPAKMDDLFNWIPARVSALVMLLAGRILGLDAKNGWRIFRRDRYNHASPNSAQTESVCAGLLGLQLAGDAWYGGVLHKKQFIGDPVREIETKDIERSCRLMYASAAAGLIIALAARA